jgi:tetratricopeptide (TPR) repeat protein
MPSDTEDAESDTPSEFSATPEARLAQAEELLRALEDQPRLSTDDATAEPFPWPANELGDAAGRDIQAPALPPIRRTGRLLGVLMLLLFSGALLAGGVWGYVHYVAPRLAGMTGDEPDAEALFRAAIAAQLEPAADEGAARDRDRRALGRFEAFAGAYPAHPKAPRARVLMGVLQHRLGDHAQAVRTLTPFLQAGPPGPDPEGWVPAMRTMARSLARLGRYSEAAETYRAAVVSPSNSTPEVDYEELGSLMLEWASAHGDEAGRELLPRAAAEYWGLAIAVPGIDPLERARIQQQRDALLEQLREADAASTPAVQPAEIPED